MATLTVRQVTAKDLMTIPRVRQRWEHVAQPGRGHPGRVGFIDRVSLVAPGKLKSTRAFLSLIDDELCGYIVLQRRADDYRWDVIEMAAGSPRLDATANVSVELWIALLECAIKESGAEGARRLFAAAPAGSTAYEAFVRAGFSPYSRYYELQGRLDEPDVPPPGNLREQHDSDVWSIHQLYHRLTPQPVQYAEAMTSDEWLVGERSRIPFSGRSRPHATVVDTVDGISAYCRVKHTGGRPLVRVLCVPGFVPHLVALVSATLRGAGLANAEIDLVVPGYAQEYVAPFIDAGLWLEGERDALVRHTTAPMVVHPVLRPVTEVAEEKRSIRGVPSFPCRASDSARSA